MNVSGVQYDFIFFLKELCSLLVGQRADAAYHEVTEQKHNCINKFETHSQRRPYSLFSDTQNNPFSVETNPCVSG